MRLFLPFVAAACLALAPPAQAGSLKFSPKAFEVLGGMGDGGVARRPSYREQLPAALLHHTIAFTAPYSPGTIIVRTGSRKLYYVLPAGQAIEYSVGVGREGFAWSGTNAVSRKAEWPDWRPPKVMIEREAARGHTIPAFMPGGPDNPLGARAIYIGDTEFRIHGTTQPWSIGQAVSSGCIRMMNEEVIDLYNRVEIGATVVVE